jgi:hypothetical protein
VESVIVVALITGACSLVGSIGAIAVGLHNGGKVRELHVLINSNLTAQIEGAVKAALAEGVKVGTANGITQERAAVAQRAVIRSEERDAARGGQS